MPAATAARTANLRALHMASPTAGWAVGTTGLLRTTDAGTHWRQVTPPAISRRIRRSPCGLVTAFLGPKRAWVAVDNAVVSRQTGQSRPPTELRLLRTTDGGRYWRSLPPLHLGTFYYAGTLHFVSREAGWLEIIRNVGAGSVWFDVYWTCDGGVHWRRVLRVVSPHPSSGAPLGCDLCDSGLTFSSSTTGWFTGCWCGIGTASSFLYVSRDTGRMWRPLSLPAPPHIPLGTIATLPPTLLGRHDGTLPAVVYQRIATSGRERACFDAYATHDDGRHWAPTTPVPISYPQAGPEILHSFPDSRHGFFIVGKRLYRTRDGGRRWQAVVLHRPLDRSATIQFLDGDRGFALRGDMSGQHSFLWRTRDGGETWQTVPTMIGSSRASVSAAEGVSRPTRVR